MQKYKRKLQREIKNLETEENFMKNPINYFKQVGTIKYI